MLSLFFGIFRQYIQEIIFSYTALKYCTCEFSLNWADSDVLYYIHLFQGEEGKIRRVHIKESFYIENNDYNTT